MIDVLIIDDEEDARFMLQNLLERHFADKINVLGEADDVGSALDLIQKTKPQLVFLDIQMKEGTGFDVLQRLPERNFEVVFITAYDNYALKAFDFSAIGYLLKPIRLSDLKRVIENLTDKIGSFKDNSDKRYTVLIENYGDDQKIKKLVIPTVDGFDVFKIEEILYLEADRNYTHFMLEKGQKVVSAKTLKAFEMQLLDMGFFRIHQSYIINLRHVVRYIKSDNGSVELSDGTKLSLSRAKKNEFMDRFLYKK